MTGANHTGAHYAVLGFAGDDILNGSSGSESLLRDVGADRISGGAGNDQLARGTGNDILDGGSGSDVGAKVPPPDQPGAVLKRNASLTRLTAGG
jgi:Ca2+-binding RTX toxin-like protein